MTATVVKKLSLGKQSNKYWKSCGVYVVDDVANRPQYTENAQKLMQRTGKANLLFLCQSLDLKFDDDASVTDLADVLLGSYTETVLCLCDFAKRRSESVKEQFFGIVPEEARAKLEVEIDALSDGKEEPVKALTMVTLLYLRDPGQIELVYARSLWRAKQTFHEYSIDTKLGKPEIAQLEKGMAVLTPRLAKLNKKPVNFTKLSDLGSGLNIFLMKRKYNPTTREDYDNDYSVVNGYGNIVIGIDVKKGKLIVKIENKYFADEIRDWVSATLKCALKPLWAKNYDSYDASHVQKTLLGDYELKHGIEIIGIKFRRSIAPNHSLLHIERPMHSGSIREDLQWYKDHKVAAITSLSDLEEFRITYKDQEATINIKIEKSGLVRFRHNDTGWEEDLQVKFMADFQKCFGLPLNQPIDPSPLMRGHIDIYRYILSCKTKEEVQPFQMDAFNDLETLGIIKPDSQKLKTCGTTGCPKHNKIVTDDDSKHCPNCQETLGDKHFILLEHDEAKICEVVGKVLATATGYKLEREADTFESLKFDGISAPGDATDVVYFCYKNQVGEKAHETLDRFAQPVIVIHTSGQYEHAFVDPQGIAHLGFSYILAATKDPASNELLKAECSGKIKILKQNFQARILRASAHSYTILSGSLKGYKGQFFETDKFNLLRYLFPNTKQWGGPNKPDGMCSIIHYDDNDMTKQVKYNWSYDTKLTEADIEGYAMGDGEKRKIWDYIMRMAGKPPFNANYNILNAHVIITNSIKRVKCKNVVKFVREDHRLGTKYPSLKLGFMRHDFVVRLYERVSAESEKFRKAINLLYQAVAQKLNTPGPDGYSWLDDATADDIATWVLKQDPIEQPLDQLTLLENMKNKEFA